MYIETKLLIIAMSLSLTTLLYTAIGTSGKVAEIREKAPQEMVERNWEILRYEGYQYGSWGRHGGKVWYHVRNMDNHNIQYRVYITMWKGELQYNYGAPERLNRIQIEY